MVFPVPSVMPDRSDDCRTALQARSAPLMPFIDWRPTVERNPEVLNETADLYRYFDCMGEAELCIRASDSPLSRTCRAKSTIRAATTKLSAASWMRSNCRTGLLKTW